MPLIYNSDAIFTKGEFCYISSLDIRNNIITVNNHNNNSAIYTSLGIKTYFIPQHKIIKLFYNWNNDVK